MKRWTVPARGIDSDDVPGWVMTAYLYGRIRVVRGVLVIEENGVGQRAREGDELLLGDDGRLGVERAGD